MPLPTCSPRAFGRTTLLLVGLLLAAVLGGCGGGGIFGDVLGGGEEPLFLREAVYDSASGEYRYVREYLVAQGPDDTDYTRWAIAYGGYEAHLLFLRKSETPQVYLFLIQDDGTFAYVPTGQGPLQVVNAPADADFSTISAVYDQNHLRLYAKSRANPFLLHQFRYDAGTHSFLYGAGGLPQIPITGLPGDADVDRWAMHADTSDYRVLVFRSGSDSELYQCGFDASTTSYAYGYHSRDVVSLVGMPAGTITTKGDSLHTRSGWRFYMLGHQ